MSKKKKKEGEGQTVGCGKPQRLCEADPHGKLAGSHQENLPEEARHACAHHSHG